MILIGFCSCWACLAHANLFVTATSWSPTAAELRKQSRGVVLVISSRNLLGSRGVSYSYAPRHSIQVPTHFDFSEI